MHATIGNLVRKVLVLAGVAAAAPALAAGGTQVPDVDFASLPDTAEVRPTNLDGKPHQAVARLLSDRTAVSPGQTFRLGVELTADNKWHSYWKSPGDIGQPLVVDWTLPPGAEVSTPEFPIPHRFEDSGIVSYGYEGSVLIFSEVTLHGDQPLGTASIQAEANWLVCESTCIPGEATLTLPLEVVPPGDPRAEPTPWAGLFDHFAAQHPTPLPEVNAFGIEHALGQSAYRPGDPFEVAFLLTPTTDQPLSFDNEAGTWPSFTPIVDQYQIFLFESSFQEADNGGFLVVLKGDALELEALPEASQVGGLFQVKVGDEWVRTEYTTPVTWAAAGTEVLASTSPLWALAEGEALAVSEPESAPEAPAGGLGLLPMLGLALLGGMLLNVMPCVFPVITLKLFGLVEHAHADAARRRRSAIAYTLGILVSFWALAAAVLVLKASVGGIGWGFQFQSPIYVAALATVVFAFGLSLFGVFEIPAIGADSAASAASKGGLTGDFMNGVFATLLATPCSAPFLGTAVGFAFAQPSGAIVLFFTVIGLGLALPFAAVAFIPALMKLMPHPGAWMETFKQLLGFTLVATAVWLVSILAEQVGTEGAVGFLAFLATVSVGAWVFGRWGGLEQPGTTQLGALAVGVVISAAGGWMFLDLEQAQAGECYTDNLVTDLAWEEGEIPWQRFSTANVEQLEGYPVFIDFTAEWCLTCKVNERTILNTEDVRTAMQQHGVIPLVADWTRRDEEITEWLQRYGRAGVPFYLVIPADPAAAPIPLPEVITRQMVIDALAKGAGEG